jgi:hypothetical protein
MEHKKEKITIDIFYAHTNNILREKYYKKMGEDETYMYMVQKYYSLVQNSCQ